MHGILFILCYYTNISYIDYYIHIYIDIHVILYMYIWFHIICPSVHIIYVIVYYILYMTLLTNGTSKVIHWCMYSYIQWYFFIIIIIIIYKHIIIHISFIYNTIPLNVLYSSSNSSSFWTKFEQSLNKFVSILVVIYIISKQQYNRKYNRKEDYL